MTVFLMLGVTESSVTMVTSVWVTTAAADSGRLSDDFRNIGSLLLNSVEEETNELVFDESEAGARVDAEGSMIMYKDFFRMRVVRKEIEPSEGYREFLSKRLRLETIMRRRILQEKGDWVSLEYEADHEGTIRFLDLIEPHIETRDGREQIARARLGYAAKAFSASSQPGDKCAHHFGGRADIVKGSEPCDGAQPDLDLQRCW